MASIRPRQWSYVGHAARAGARHRYTGYVYAYDRRMAHLRARWQIAELAANRWGGAARAWRVTVAVKVSR